MPLNLAEELKLINQYRKSAPVDVSGLVKALGLQLEYAFLRTEISGILEKDGDTYKITVNDRDPPTRKRFTIAHELGHYMFHRDRIGNGIEDDRAYRSTGMGKYQNNRIGLKEEAEANQFAASLLMPSDLIDRLRKEGFVQAKQLAEKLGVSARAMEIRLGYGN